MMKRILSVMLSALLVMLLFSGCTAALQERGTAQGDNPKQQKNTIPVEYSYQYTNMGLELPDDWAYDILAGDGERETGEPPAYSYGIQFWPRAEPSMKITFHYYINGIGLCGTGVTFEEISFENRLTATKCTEDQEYSNGDRFWFFLIYHDVPGAYAVECSTSKDLWSEYEETVMSILESVEVGKGILSETEAIEIAKTKCTIPYDDVRGYFSHVDGVWEVRFSATNMNGENQDVQKIRIEPQQAVKTTDEHEFIVNSHNTIAITKYIGEGGDLEIPAEIDGKKVTEIQDNAFQGCTSLKTVRIPASVTLLGNCAFDACPNLKALYFEGDAPQTGNYVFYPPLPTIYYHKGATGWSNPWYGCSTETY